MNGGAFLLLTIHHLLRLQSPEPRTGHLQPEPASALEEEGVRIYKFVSLQNLYSNIRLARNLLPSPARRLAMVSRFRTAKLLREVKG